MCACLQLLKCVLRDHNSNNCTHSGNVCCCTYMVNNDYDKFRSFSRLYMTLFWHQTCTHLHGKAYRFLVLASNGQVTALGDWALVLVTLAITGQISRRQTPLFRARYHYFMETFLFIIGCKLILCWHKFRCLIVMYQFITNGNGPFLVGC